MKQLPLEVVRAVQHDERVLERFWSYVDTDSEGGCWEWRGPVTHGDYPRLIIGRFSIPAARVAWFTATGELPVGGRVFHNCQNPLCVRPEHLAWAVSQRTERVLNALGDGYLTASGVPVVTPAQRARMPRVLRYVSAPRELIA
ncbi:MAG TPA: HNH endonuclease [Gemmatimonadaceae bacterium]|nr:HNH endonuclease [Gemmatimonadaceae bacterium]